MLLARGAQSWCKEGSQVFCIYLACLFFTTYAEELIFRLNDIQATPLSLFNRVNRLIGTLLAGPE